jgi:hypothetical protein
LRRKLDAAARAQQRRHVRVQAQVVAGQLQAAAQLGRRAAAQRDAGVDLQLARTGDADRFQRCSGALAQRRQPGKAQQVGRRTAALALQCQPLLRRGQVGNAALHVAQFVAPQPPLRRRRFIARRSNSISPLACSTTGQGEA